MNCPEVLDLLSPLHDGELPTELQKSVEQHLRECCPCAAVRREYRSLSGLARQLPDPQPPETLWQHIDAALHPDAAHNPGVVQEPREPHTESSDPDPETGNDLSRRPETPAAISRRQWVRGAAAAILLTAASAVFVIRQPDHDEHLAANFDRFLSEFPRSAERAQQLLHANYPGSPVSIDEAIVEVKYRPAVANGLPEGYSLDSVHLVRMPCCLCVEALCTAPDGARLAVLEHAIDQPIWFGDRPSEICRCNGRDARLVRFDGRFAATWKSDQRYVTVVGVRDENELASLMQHLDPQKL